MDLLPGLSGLLGPGGLLALAAVVLALLVLRPFRNRHQRQRDANAAGAAQRGWRYQPPSGNGGPGPVDEGSHRYSGEDDGIAWTVETYLLADDGAGTDAAPAAARSYSRWTSAVEADAFGGRGYLLLLNLPAGAARPAVRPGPFDILLDKMAAMALFLYVRSYFGEPRAGHLALDPRHRRQLGDETLDQLYTVFAEPAARLTRLNAATRAWLREQHALQAAVLWDGAGLAVSHPCTRATPEQAGELTARALRLAGLRDRAAERGG